jgi:type IV secretory pathway VirB3-like protein
MDGLRVLAFQTIGRGVGFAGFGIACMMAALSFDPLMAVRAGGVLSLLLVAVLLIKARAALTADPRDTEMWLYLERSERPAEAYAQWAAATVLREAYFWFARWTAGVAAVLWTLAVLLALFRGALD